MTITFAEFLHLLNAHRLMDVHMGYLNMEKIFLCQWAIGNDGCHYVPAMQRDLPNHGVVMIREIIDRAGYRLPGNANHSAALR